MRRIDIINSIVNVRKAVKDTGVFELFRDLMRQGEKVGPEAIIRTSQEYMVHYRSFGDNEKHLLSLFELNGLHNPRLWSEIISALLSEKSRPTDIVYPVYSSLNFMYEYLPKLIELFKQDNTEYVTDKNELLVAKSIKDGGEIITVILPENSNEISSHPDRLIRVISSINVFYKAISIIIGHNENDLSVVAIDSGSDKSFDFLGAAKVVTAVKELIIDLWDRVVFFKEKKLHERMDLIGKSIPIIENINQLEKEEKISKEQAEILRRDILNGVKDFLSAGAILPDFSDHNNYNPRQLMAPEPKLLTMPSNLRNDASGQITVEDSYENSLDTESDNLTLEERETLNKLLKKGRKEGNTE